MRFTFVQHSLTLLCHPVWRYRVGQSMHRHQMYTMAFTLHVRNSGIGGSNNCHMQVNLEHGIIYVITGWSYMFVGFYFSLFIYITAAQPCIQLKIEKISSGYRFGQTCLIVSMFRRIWISFNFSAHFTKKKKKSIRTM